MYAFVYIYIFFLLNTRRDRVMILLLLRITPNSDILDRSHIIQFKVLAITPVGTRGQLRIYIPKSLFKRMTIAVDRFSQINWFPKPNIVILFLLFAR